jgi:hypothetical protein
MPGRCYLQDSDCGGLRGGSGCRIQTWAGAELVVCKIAQTLLLVPSVLLLAIPLDGMRVLLAILPPVIGVAVAPFLRTV